MELKIDTKKELYIQENKLFEFIKNLNLKNGTLHCTVVEKYRRELKKDLSPLFLYMIKNNKEFNLFSKKIKEANFY
nr:MAG TPA: hypothetical protein [Bacteriophage sp.]